MENLPLGSVEPRYEAAKREPAHASVIGCRTRTSTRYSSDESSDTAHMRADRSGIRRMGHRILETRREPTQPPIRRSGACRAAGCIARSCHAGDASNAPVRAAGMCAGRSSERRHARRARDRGVARILPRAGPQAGESGGTGSGEREGRRFRRHGGGGDATALHVGCRDIDDRRSRALHVDAAGNRSGRDDPLAAHRFVRTPASSRSDRRPDARRRRSRPRPAPRG